MENNSNCFLCGNEASIENVKGSANQRFNVACVSECPEYEITRIAVNYFTQHPAHRDIAQSEIVRIASLGKIPLIKTFGNPKQLRVTSREDEQHEIT